MDRLRYWPWVVVDDVPNGALGSAKDGAKDVAKNNAHISEIFASYQGEGVRVGQRHLFVRFAGCNLRCGYCDTPYSLTPVAKCRVDLPGGDREVLDNPISVSRLARIVSAWCEADPGLAMIAITGGEPMVQHEFLRHWLSTAAPDRGCLLETNAMLTEGLAELLPLIEIVSADIKLPSNSGEGDLWDQHRAFFDICGRFACRVYVKVPVDSSTSSADVARAARLVATAAPQAIMYLQPLSDPRTDEWKIDLAGLESFAALAARDCSDTRILPQVHKLLGQR